MCYLYRQWWREFDRIERYWREVSLHRVGGPGGVLYHVLLTYTMGQMALCQARGSWLMSHVSSLNSHANRRRGCVICFVPLL